MISVNNIREITKKDKIKGLSRNAWMLIFMFWCYCVYIFLSLGIAYDFNLNDSLSDFGIF